ncbi:hypothetical protein Poli38472_013293 [Pythium oligandrum]|uniref:Uncharacterized protein n=1 Tax=Pythium oligandrum TaxID=41045 RepID=A0A8K1C2T6_PYTOL|nr:hypothetical protein Poli38472_013293 [Pythium oligandrum]|eukprot:TMW55402.1 hypothetical protein Poli38472_013293 [Pythium oligandrum]
MALPSVGVGGDALVKFFVQFVFLFTGVFSTCAAQYVFYQGAGDQKAMLLPLCNYLGMMLVGLIPMSSSDKAKTEAVPTSETTATESMRQTPGHADGMELTRRQVFESDASNSESETDTDSSSYSSPPSSSPARLPSRLPPRLASPAPSDLKIRVTKSTVSCSMSSLQLCILLSVVLDFAGCIFSNIGLAMAGSGLYQVVYSSVICWSALLSRIVLKKIVSKEEWFGIALVTFGLAFSAMGASGPGHDSYVVLMGCLNTLIGAGFYGGNYVTGEYTLKLPARPQPKELCLKIGGACVAIIAVYQLFFVLPVWDELVTNRIEEAHGNTNNILLALVGYTLSQLAHGLTYFMMLGSSGAVTTGIMQSLRAVCVFAISSVLYCSQQESQCFDTKRGIATLIVVSGVMFYSWAKSQATVAAPVALPVTIRRKDKLISGKNLVV